jgi:hypothetical protein
VTVLRARLGRLREQLREQEEKSSTTDNMLADELNRRLQVM